MTGKILLKYYDNFSPLKLQILQMFTSNFNL